MECSGRNAEQQQGTDAGADDSQGNRKRQKPTFNNAFRAKGSDPPTLMKINAIMFVATATCGSTPNAIITGTVMRDVLPVTTLMTLVTKKTAARMASFDAATSSSYQGCAISLV